MLKLFMKKNCKKLSCVLIKLWFCKVKWVKIKCCQLTCDKWNWNGIQVENEIEYHVWSYHETFDEKKMSLDGLAAAAGSEKRWFLIWLE